MLGLGLLLLLASAAAFVPTNCECSRLFSSPPPPLPPSPGLIAAKCGTAACTAKYNKYGSSNGMRCRPNMAKCEDSPNPCTYQCMSKPPKSRYIRSKPSYKPPKSAYVRFG